jgi:4-hydroxythreonine-4-phosphate dehydrogenase
LTIAEAWTDAPLAVALGDPAGIGPEIAVKAWLAKDRESLAPFFAVGDERSIQAVWSGPVQRIHDPAEAAAVFGRALPLLSVEDGGEIVPGRPNLEGARCSLDSLEVATGLTRSGTAAALVTGPVSKAQLYVIGFTHPGQTEFVAERCGISPENVVMMLTGPDLRVVPVTTHMPLSQVALSLSTNVIVAKARTTVRGLQRNFGIAEPRLAFAGLNPHAGESGALGTEEIDIIEPAIAELRAEGVDVTGPLAADTMFHARARARYDAAICLYHDQALIPLKTLYFDIGVNMTLGLPIVRTAPDHGTAFAIAGKGQAHPGATIAAIRLAAEAVSRRKLECCPA